MSGKMFKKRMGKGLKKGAEYKRAKLENQGFVDDVLALYLDRTLEQLYDTNHKGDDARLCAERLASQLSSGNREELDFPALLDGVTYHISRDVEPLKIGNALNHLLNPLVQALYMLDYNGFFLDLSHLPLSSRLSVAKSLKGVEGNLLEAAFMGSFDEFGYRAGYSKLHLLGDAYRVGLFSYSSDFILERAAGFIGTVAHGSRFTFPGVDDATLERHISNHSRPLYRLVRKKGGATYETFMYDDFFDHGNSILVPDGNGSWKEVRPE